MRIAVQGGGLAAGDVEWRLRGSGVEEVRFTLSAQKKGVRWFRNQLTSGWCRSGMRMIFEISEDHSENYSQSGDTLQGASEFSKWLISSGVLTSGMSILVRYFLFSVSHFLPLESSGADFLATLAFLVIFGFLAAPAAAAFPIVAVVSVFVGLTVVLALLRYRCS
ncbi:hypothetical protein CGMCC3_g13194 [Colletotrichum fructicola]|nr:uncharacterized protein CGMCC3_g13194 [Colletotrichum fructicola]KAE9570759.1 hypothetical protein CGMCC3_g13194 [Colletotrichum fructicola]